MKPSPPIPALLEDVIAFLKSSPPFQFLEDADITAVARNLSLEFYPKDLVIMKQDGPPSDALRIIKKGGVKMTLTPEEGGEVVIDYRGEGETFGFLSMVGKDRVRSNVVAVEDTLCYVLPADRAMKLLDSNVAFIEYFFKSHIARYIDKTAREMQDRAAFSGGSDRLLFTTRIGDLAIQDVVTAPEDATVRDAALLMAEHRISSAVILDGNGLPAGIVTDRDLREKVVARGRDVREPVRNIMNAPLIHVDSRDICFEAVLRMIRHNIHHIIVLQDGKLAGVLTNHDLMVLQGTSPLSLTKDIESQHTLEGLARASLKINGIVGLQLKEGARADNIAKIITELNDRVVRKVLEAAEKKFGRPPVPFSWIGFGSEGRKEQIFKTDQDNAIIYADPPPAGAEAARRYFSEFALFARDSLVRCGFPPCPKNYMASTPEWCQPLAVWKQYFSQWVSTPTPEALYHARAIFDFRHRYGEEPLAEALRDHLHALLAGNKVFLAYLANMVIRNSPPLGFFNSFVVEKDGAHKDMLNLKMKGLAPLVDVIRLFALEGGVRETSTFERIDILRGAHTIVQEYADEFVHAFEFLLLLRTHHQYAQTTRGESPDNFIDPTRLSNLEKRSLKEAFRLVSKVQDLIGESAAVQAAASHFY